MAWCVVKPVLEIVLFWSKGEKVALRSRRLKSVAQREIKHVEVRDCPFKSVSPTSVVLSLSILG